jgi:metal-responsive CopG/Arc/MetJ family transcriptional regulator
MPDLTKDNEPEVTISISGVPKSLLNEIERVAKKDRRNRSSLIVKLLEASVRTNRKQAA